MSTENKTNGKHINLCDTCQSEYPECSQPTPTFGDGIGMDNIIECDLYQESQEKRIKMNFEEFKKSYDGLSEEDALDLFEAKRKKAEQEQANKRQEDMDTYKKLVTEGVDELFPVLENLSNSLSAAKKRVYDKFNAALDLKKDLFRVKESQYNHTFINEKKNRRITLGNITKDGFDDTVNEGIQMVKDYISSLATDAASQELVNTVLQLLSKDNKGNLKASKIVTLNNLAAKSDSQLFKEGVDIIQRAYTPEVSKQYVRVERKNEHGMWVTVPLGMTEV